MPQSRSSEAPSEHESLSQYLRRVRLTRGWDFQTAVRVVGAYGLSAAELSRLEAGLDEISAATLDILAKAFALSLDWLQQAAVVSRQHQTQANFRATEAIENADLLRDLINDALRDEE